MGYERAKLSIYEKLNADKKIIAGIGNALVDILIHEEEEFLLKINALKGGMTLVEKDRVENNLNLSKGKPRIVAGGSACNTAVGVSGLGGQARFIGKCGEDRKGVLFKEGLEKDGVEPILFKSSLPTGRVLSIITPDVQRTMLTYLGAASELTPEDVATASFSDLALVHLEGYLLFNTELMYSALDSAQQAGAVISLDLSSFTVVEESKTVIQSIVSEYVDILIANEDEARAFTGHSDEKAAIESLAGWAELSVLKVGERGSYIAHEGEVIKIHPMGNGDAVDTTGAGDLWASGFLFGLINRFPLEKCGMLGSICGYEVCQVVGAKIFLDGWERIDKQMELIL